MPITAGMLTNVNNIKYVKTAHIGNNIGNNNNTNTNNNNNVYEDRYTNNNNSNNIDKK